MRLSRSRLLLTAAGAICDCDSDCIFAKGLDHHNITVDSESINVLLTGRVSPWGKEGRKKSDKSACFGGQTSAHMERGS